MYTYRTLSSPNTHEAALERVAELQRMFVFESYIVAETTDRATGDDDVDIIAVNETDEGGHDTHRTMGAVMGAYIEACEARGLKVWNIDEIKRKA